jgi:hypothetical protein
MALPPPLSHCPPKADPRNLAGKMQPRRLTDSHYWSRNPRRGFELMKMAGRSAWLCRIDAARAGALMHR